MENLPMNQDSGYIITIEWDGQKPPTRWYTFLAKYGLNTRQGSKDTSPIARRASTSGVAFQEGTIIVHSDSLARQLATLAYSMNAKSVMLGTITMGQFKMTQEDQHALEVISAQTGKRGPKAKENEGRYVIHCYEEGKTRVADLREAPLACPHCHGLRISWWRGEARKVMPFNAQEHDLDKYWVSTRFDENGRFSIPMTSNAITQLETVDEKKLSQGAQNNVYIVRRFVHNFAEKIDGNGLEILQAMDMAYCVQELPTKVRQDKRIKAMLDYYASGGEEAYEMRLDPTDVDIVDVASMDNRFIEKM
jgi:Zn finger protein HypA/HybF involved in hydrogenase expression